MDYHNLHLAIIMDGNGRWAQLRELARSAGHRAGAQATREVVETAAELGIGVLTLYAFSADNWSRPRAEVSNVMRLLRRYLRNESNNCQRNDIRLSIIGRRDRLTPDTLRAIELAEHKTRDCTGMMLRLAVDYSATHAIATAAAQYCATRASSHDFARILNLSLHSPDQLAPVDLLIRTGGEQRLSDFLLFECAYAELLFMPTLWPDFGSAQLLDALTEFRRRDRRFGCIAAQQSAAHNRRCNGF